MYEVRETLMPIARGDVLHTAQSIDAATAWLEDEYVGVMIERDYAFDAADAMDSTGRIFVIERVK